MTPAISEFVDRWSRSPFAASVELPWHLTRQAEAYVSSLLRNLDRDYASEGGVAIHRTASVEAGAILKSPVVIGPDSFVAATAYLRGGVFLDEDCVVGPGVEIKSSFIFKGSKLAHFNFVGDSIIGSDVNLEAGSIVANYRNELAGRRTRIRWNGNIIDTDVEKFGAVIGDGVRIGANAVIAPGALIAKGAVIQRLMLVDQCPVDLPTE
jgi:NDP-sugar pyrophosphorylase family protein